VNVAYRSIWLGGKGLPYVIVEQSVEPISMLSGCFRSGQYARAYCRISSYLQTMANKGYNPLISIQMALAGEVGLGGGRANTFIKIIESIGYVIAILNIA